MSQANLSDRVDRLEKQNKSLKRWIAGVGALCLSAGFFMSMNPVCKTVWAERFVLRDAQNRQRGLWDAYTRNGNPTLQLFDEKGKLSMAISLDDDGGPSLSYVEGSKLVSQPIGRSADDPKCDAPSVDDMAKR